MQQLKKQLIYDCFLIFLYLSFILHFYSFFHFFQICPKNPKLVFKKPSYLPKTVSMPLFKSFLLCNVFFIYSKTPKDLQVVLESLTQYFQGTSSNEHEKIIKQSYISFCFSYCMYFYDIRLMHLLIDEIGQLGIITVQLGVIHSTIVSYISSYC